MKKKLYGAAALGVVGVLALSFARPGITSATVPGVNLRASVDSSGNQSNQSSYYGSTNGNGRYVVFESEANNLVSGDTNSARDIFVRDTIGGTTVRASVSSSGAQSNADSGFARISNDGRYVVFASMASNLVSGDTNNTYDVFVRDLTAGTTARVSTTSSGGQSNQASSWPDVSADGRYVVFESPATNLDGSISGSITGYQVYVKDTQTGAIKMLSRDSSNGAGNGDSRQPQISCDGGTVAFYSEASNLVSGDTNGVSDIFVDSLGWNADTLTNATINGNAYSNAVSISCDGNAVALQSAASNLVSGDTNSAQDIFEYNRLTQSFERVSVDSSSTQAVGNSSFPAISGDGRFVTFQNSSQMQANDTNNSSDTYIRDIKNGTTQLVSINVSSYGSGNTDMSDISDDGSFVVYASPMSTLVSGDTNGYQDIFESQTGF